MNKRPAVIALTALMLGLSSCGGVGIGPDDNADIYTSTLSLTSANVTVPSLTTQTSRTETTTQREARGGGVQDDTQVISEDETATVTTSAPASTTTAPAPPVTTAVKPVAVTETVTTTAKPVTTASSAEVQTDKPSEDHTAVISSLEDIFKPVTSSGGRYAVKVVSLESGTEFGSGEQNAALVSASLIKLYVAGAVYENYAAVDGQRGYSGETEVIIGNMISQSDNIACNTLVQRLGSGNYDRGIAAVNAYCIGHGFTATRMNRIMLNFNGMENYTSAADCCKFLSMICRSELTGSDKIIEYMKAQKTRTKIPAGITDGTAVANKTGELAAVENDTAIVYAGSGTYLICVMTCGLSNTAAARKCISQAAAKIHAYMK